MRHWASSFHCLGTEVTLIHLADKIGISSVSKLPPHLVQLVAPTALMPQLKPFGPQTEQQWHRPTCYGMRGLRGWACTATSSFQTLNESFLSWQGAQVCPQHQMDGLVHEPLQAASRY